MAIIYVGLDVHKETIAVALAEAGKRSEVLEHGKIANTLSAVLRSWLAAGTNCGSAMRRGLAATAFSGT